MLGHLKSLYLHYHYDAESQPRSGRPVLMYASLVHLRQY